MAKNRRKGIRFPKIESRSLKYGYSNARAKAMKGLVLAPAILEEMIKVRSIHGMIDLLNRTPYRKEVNDHAIREHGIKLVEMAIAQRFINMAQRIFKITPKDDQPIVKALLKKWDLVMLQMLINAKRAGKSKEELKPYLMAITPEYRKGLEIIASAEDVFSAFKKTQIGHNIMENSVSSMSKDMEKRFRKATAAGDKLGQIEMMLEIYRYNHVQTAFADEAPDVQRVHKILRREIDIRNITTIERLKKKGQEGKAIEEYLIEGGMLPQRTLKRLLTAKDLQEVLERLKFYWGEITLEEQTTIGLEIALEKTLAKEKVKAFHRSVLSLGALLSVMLILEEEVHNIRKIAKAKEFGLSEDEVRKTLVVI